jgi:hypothetical protein
MVTRGSLGPVVGLKRIAAGQLAPMASRRVVYGNRPGLKTSLVDLPTDLLMPSRVFNG